MALNPLYLADKSALARFDHPPVGHRLGPLLVDGMIATCPIIDLEILYSARSLADYEAVLAERRSLVSYPITEQVTDRAIDVQHQLAHLGQHRIALPDLLIAAVAELNEVTVLHYDADYDRIASITQQPSEWIALRGSIP